MAAARNVRLTGIAAFAALGSIVGCLRQSPVYAPASVYDADAAVRQAHLAGVDSLSIDLVSADDSTRMLPLWEGDPATAGKLPVKAVGDGEHYYFRIRGFSKIRGYCFGEDLGGGRDGVFLDSCVPGPAHFLNHEIVFEDINSISIPMLVQGEPAADTALELRTDAPWLVLPSRYFSLAIQGPLGVASLELTLNWPMVPAHDLEAMVYLSGNGKILDSLHVRAAGRPDNLRPFQGATMDLGYLKTSAQVSFWQPPVSNPRWFSPPDAPWLAVEIKGGPAGEPGDYRTLNVTVDRGKLGHDTELRAVALVLDDSAQPIDSLIVIVRQYAPEGGAVGRLVTWNDSLPMNGLRVVVDDGAAAALSDPDGYFAFTGLKPGRHLASVRLAGAVGAAAAFTADSAGRAVIGTLTASLPAQFGDVVAAPAGAAMGGLTSGGFEGVIAVRSGAAGGLVRFDLSKLDFVYGALKATGTPPDSSVASVAAYGRGYLFLAYPRERRLGVIHDWVNSSRVESLDLPIHPASLLVDGSRLVVAGELPGGAAALAMLNAESRALQRIDTLEGSLDTAADPRLRVVTMGDAYYVLEAPAADGSAWLIKIGRNNPSQRARARLPGDATDLCAQGGRIYVSALSGPLRAYGPDLSPADSLPSPFPLRRLACDEWGWGRDLIFAAGADDSLSVYHSLEKTPVGRLSLHGASVDDILVDALDNLIVVSGGDQARYLKF